MNCVRDMVISSEFLNISFYTRLISCLKDTSYNLEVPIVYKSTSEITYFLAQWCPQSAFISIIISK